MACFRPLEGWRARHVGSSGKRAIVFNRRDGFSDLPVKVPCGQCIGCRLERSRQWAVRCMHEAQLHDENCFLTLTYDDLHVPDGGTLLKEDHQKFLKRLRRRVDSRLSFFLCGEYGEQLSRPHYHALIFGYGFPDRVPFRSNGRGETLWRSPLLEELWPMGHSSIGAVTFESAAYVARYALKKITGDAAEAHYQGKLPEYCAMSLKPGIGKRWYEKFSDEVEESDSLVMRGVEMKPPRYYDKLLEARDERARKDLKYERIKGAVKFKWNNTPERLRVREKVKSSQIKLLKRELK